MSNPRACALAATLLACLTTPAHAEKRAFGIEDFYRVVNPGHVDVAPDGRSVVYHLRSTDLPRGESNRDLYRLSTADGAVRRLTWSEDASESAPAYSPDGETIAFVSSRGERDHAQLWLMPVSGGEARELTALPFDLADPVWSPDGRFVAVTAGIYPDCGVDVECHEQRETRREDGPLSAHIADELLYRHWDSWHDGKYTHVLLIDVETGDARDMTPGLGDAPGWSLSSGGISFSPDGAELCYTRNGDAFATHAWSTNGDIWRVPVAAADDGSTRPARNLTADNPAWDGAPVYSPNGRYLAYLTHERAGYESDLVRLALLDLEGGERRILTPGFDNNVDEVHWLPDGTGLIFTAPSAGAKPLYHVGLDGKAPREIANLAYVDEVALTPDGKGAWVVRHSVGEPREIWHVDLTDGAARRVTGHNREFADEVDIRPAESIWVEGSGGKKIHVFIVKPHGFKKGRRYPLILSVHGGPQGMFADGFRGDWQVYPGAGYVVAFANPHGSTGYGQELTEQISGDWGGRVFEDLMRVTDELEKLPYVDAKRMGAMGWSYGGYMMNWFQGHTDRFKCLADMMGIFDTRSFYYATEELWFPEWDLGGRPWDSGQYERWNPAASAGKFRTPMLIISGELDYRVPYTQGLMSFTALRRQGVPARLIVLPDAGHWPEWYEMALYYTAHVDWFHRWLGGDPAPWSVENFADNAVFDTETGARIDVEDDAGK